MEILATAGSPADSFAGVFPLPLPGQKNMAAPAFLAVEVRQGANVLFAGGVDEQRETVSGKGCFLTIGARSKGALLLDNEALPQLYQNPRLSDLFRNHMAPYGFDRVVVRAAGVSANPALSFYSVSKGLCEWEAVAGFCRRATGQKLYVVGNSILLGRPTGNDVARHLVANDGTAGALPYTLLERQRQRSGVISSVMIRHPIGLYLSQYKNPFCGGLDIRRKRYIIPSTEYAEEAASRNLDAALRVKESMAGFESWRVHIPGIVPIRVHDTVTLLTPLVSAADYVVRGVRHMIGQGGAVTRLMLGDGRYFS